MGRAGAHVERVTHVTRGHQKGWGGGVVGAGYLGLQDGSHWRCAAGRALKLSCMTIAAFQAVHIVTTAILQSAISAWHRICDDLFCDQVPAEHAGS